MRKRGSMAVEWLELSPYRKQVHGLSLVLTKEGPFCAGFACCPHAWVGFLPQQLKYQGP